MTFEINNRFLTFRTVLMKRLSLIVITILLVAAKVKYEEYEYFQPHVGGALSDQASQLVV